MARRTGRRRQRYVVRLREEQIQQPELLEQAAGDSLARAGGAFATYEWPTFQGKFPAQCRILRVTSPYQQGRDVAVVQGRLQQLGFTPGPIDGVYGGITRLAVNYFQMANDITEDPSGVVGAATYKALGINCGMLIAPDPTNLVYNNPYAQSSETVWYKGRLVLSLDLGQLDCSPEEIKWSPEYFMIYGFDQNGEPEFVPGQLYIYATAPGDPDYSPIWRYYYVIVPRDYIPNTLRSAEDVLNSGYQIIETDILDN